MSEPNISPQPKANPALSHTTSIVLCAMFTALTYVFTMINVNFGGPGGLIHLGNIPFFIAAIIFGKKIGMVSGGVGMALFDVLSSYTLWAPFTLVIGFATGYVVGLITERHKSFPYYILAMFGAAVVKIVGYYIAEGIIYGNWIAPVYSILPNLMQVVAASIAVLILIEPLRLAAQKTILRGHV